jgi:hypothetical protein
MPSNPHRPGASAANSFRADEIEAASQLFASLDRGGDVSRILRSPALVSLRVKVAKMRAAIARSQAEVASLGDARRARGAGE